MSDKRKLNVVFCWHMHQPHYKDLIGGEYQLPWTYLHAIKDYSDMAAHLEEVPNARAVVNFAPILLEQISDYATQVANFFRDGSPIADPLLGHLYKANLPAAMERRVALARACLRANKTRLIDRFPSYRKLAELAEGFFRSPEEASYMNDQFLADLLVWYHLAWLGESVRRSDVRVKRLMEKGSGYSMYDRRQLLEVIRDVLGRLIGRYSDLASRGQIELSISPYAHPIVPLLLDLPSAREAMPDIVLPKVNRYPGGEERSRWHIQKSIEVFEYYFGARPVGCWPSEGSVSAATVRLLSEYGFRWAASGATVLHNSLRAGGEEAAAIPCLHQAFRTAEADLACFFRDDGLSDLVGFSYADWHADDAVANLVHHLENIAKACANHPDPVVSIIMDGENAWEYYPENGYYFLSALYRRLSEHPRLRLTTFAEYLGRHPQLHELPKIVAGSWVYGTFSTWIGDPEKNRGWEMLADARVVFSEAVATGAIQGEQVDLAKRQLAICEGSDWFWWFGDYNPSDTVRDFDRLYRIQLSNLYQLLGKTPPAYLTEVISHGGGTPALGGVMRPGRVSN